jgi:hypothetical protein
MDKIHHQQLLDLSMRYYPNPLYRKLVVAYGVKQGKRKKSNALEDIVKSFFSKMSDKEKSELIRFYDIDPNGDVKAVEKKKYISS